MVSRRPLGVFVACFALGCKIKLPLKKISEGFEDTLLKNITIRVEFDSTLKLTNQISHMTNFSFSKRPIPA